MDTDGRFYMTVVGVRHTVDDMDALYREIDEAMLDTDQKFWPEVTFEQELDNPYAPVAFRAKFRHRDIGHLQSGLVDEALTLTDRHGRFSAMLCGHGECQVDTWVEDPDGRLRRMAMSDTCDDRITTTALQGIGHLPILERENDFEERSDKMLLTLENYRERNLPPDDELLQPMREWLEIYKRLYRKTLCREDHGVIHRMELRLRQQEFHDGGQTDDAFYDEQGNLLASVAEIYNEAFELHKDIPKGSFREIMDYQLTHLRAIAHRDGGFLDSYRRVYLYKADHEKLLSEHGRIEQWLRDAIPYHVYARYADDPEKLARNLYYLRLTRREMYRIYEHMLVLEMLEAERRNYGNTERRKYGNTERRNYENTEIGDLENKELRNSESPRFRNSESPDPSLRNSVNPGIRNSALPHPEGAFPLGARSRVSQLKSFYEIVVSIMKAKGFASGITIEQLTHHVDDLLISKDADDAHRLLRDRVWLKVDSTKGDLLYRGLPLPRFLELLGLWHARGQIVIGVSPLADVIASRIGNMDKRDTIRQQIQRSRDKVTHYEDQLSRGQSPDFTTLPLIQQLFW